MCVCVYVNVGGAACLSSVLRPQTQSAAGRICAPVYYNILFGLKLLLSLLHIHTHMHTNLPCSYITLKPQTKNMFVLLCCTHFYIAAL